MTPHTHRRVCAPALVLTLTTATALAAPPTSEFDRAIRDGTVDWHAYVGGAWIEGTPDFGKIYGLPVELSVITPGDWSVAVDSSWVRTSTNGRTEGETGPSMVRFSKSIRNLPGIDYLTFEYDEVTKSSVDRVFEVRAQGGLTRLGYAASISSSVMNPVAGHGSDMVTAAAGYRGQFGRLHLGFDYANVNWSGEDRSQLLDATVMIRFYNGDALYAQLANTYEGARQGWSASLGYEFRFGY